MDRLPEAFAPLGNCAQWILHKNKMPVSHLTAEVADAHNPAIWTDAQTAMATAKLYGAGYGVGFVFTAKDPFWFIDIDKCLMPDNATWSPVAMDLMARLPGAAIEVSQSGRGLHLFGTGAVPEHACKNIALGLELYTEARYVALTGTNAQGDAGLDCGAAMASIVNEYFPPAVGARGDGWSTAPVPEYTSPGDNDALIAKAMAAGSAAAKFGGKASFADLWSRNLEALRDCYPDPEGQRDYDASSADAALAQHLAFWTGCNCDHMLALMWCSGLVRDKWTNHKSYLTMTITRAASLQSVVYTAGGERVPVQPVQPLAINSAPEILEGYQFLGITQQIEHFKGCIYIQDIHRVYTPNGALLNAERFNATYGGYVFALDSEASGKTTRKAWEAFTESQGVKYPKAEAMCFRPELPQGECVHEEGRCYVNIYVPIETPRAAGDPAPFLEHLAKLLPDPRDQQILLAYMAACIQHKGVKFQWAPLLQGTEGNGKTLFTRCVAFAIGKRYTHLPKADDIDNKFNGWMLNKLFIGVEDIYVPDHRREVVEALKPMITNADLEIQLKGVDQVTMGICANFILNMNDKAGFKKTANDRRFCMFYTAQQSNDDIKRDGMDGDYFPKIYAWLRGGGYAIVNEYLSTYAIPEELNPAGACHRAPITTTTTAAINASLGSVEQEILESIEEGRTGFAGGWISSMAIERLLQGMHASRRIPHNKRREMLQGIGYDWHPALKEGRTNNAILIDGGKPRLFIQDGHIHRNLTTANEVVRAYQEAQGDFVAAGVDGAVTIA
jgi:hypothetical protein